jgi:thymidylate kinase
MPAQERAVTASTAGNGTLITVTGIDGAGKSTLAVSLHAALNDCGHDAILVGKQTTQVSGNAVLSEYTRHLNAVIYRREEGVGAACGDYYWLFALAAWYSLQDQLIIQPALQAGIHVILDNSHHKILARYATRSAVPADLARQVFAHLSPPDIVLFLEVTAEQALRRKQVFSSLETGHTGSAGNAFISYQDTVAASLRLLAAGESWVPIDVTGQDAGIVLEEALGALSGRLGIQFAGRHPPDSARGRAEHACG